DLALHAALPVLEVAPLGAGPADVGAVVVESVAQRLYGAGLRGGLGGGRGEHGDLGPAVTLAARGDLRDAVGGTGLGHHGARAPGGGHHAEGAAAPLRPLPSDRAHGGDGLWRV